MFDAGVWILFVASLYVLFRRPGGGTALGLGLTVGLMAVVGRNHGIYGIAGSLLAALVLRWRPATRSFDARMLVAWIAGVFTGYVPELLMWVTVPGFGVANMEWVANLFRIGSTNTPLPIPWPWRPIDLTEEGVVYTAHQVAMGLAFVLLVVGPLLAAWTLRARRTRDAADDLLAAALCTAVPYVHYAFSRADGMHLALAGVPWCIACVVWAARLVPRQAGLALAVLLAFSVLVFVPTPPIHNLLAGRERQERIVVTGSELTVPPAIANSWRRSEVLLRDLRPGETFLGLPDMLSLHAAHHVAMPVHDIYVLFVASRRDEREEITRIARAAPTVILLSNTPYGEDDTQRFSRLRLVTYAWINRHYARSLSRVPYDDEVLEVYRRR